MPFQEVLNQSPNKPFADLVDAMAIDMVKQLALYQDDERGVGRDDITAGDVEPMFQRCREAIEAVSNESTMICGNILFENFGPERHSKSHQTRINELLRAWDEARREAAAQRER